MKTIFALVLALSGVVPLAAAASSVDYPGPANTVAYQDCVTRNVTLTQQLVDELQMSPAQAKKQEQAILHGCAQRYGGELRASLN